MESIQKIVLVIHTLIALGIIALVLLQRGKGADAGAGFGAGASGTVFGARGSGSFFSRATAVLAAAFFATSLALAYISSQHTGAPESLLEGAPVADEVVDETPASGEDTTATDMPSLEPPADAATDEVTDMPDLEVEPPAGETDQ